jgi:hypothetical protein
VSFPCYGSGIKGYKLWNPETEKTFMSRSVVFNESVIFTNSLPLERVPEKRVAAYAHAGRAC